MRYTTIVALGVLIGAGCSAKKDTDRDGATFDTLSNKLVADAEQKLKQNPKDHRALWVLAYADYHNNKFESGKERVFTAMEVDVDSGIAESILFRYLVRDPELPIPMEVAQSTKKDQRRTVYNAWISATGTRRHQPDFDGAAYDTVAKAVWLISEGCDVKTCLKLLEPIQESFGVPFVAVELGMTLTDPSLHPTAKEYLSAAVREIGKEARDPLDDVINQCRALLVSCRDQLDAPHRRVIGQIEMPQLKQSREEQAADLRRAIAHYEALVVTLSKLRDQCK